ncbi:hypothetical protein BKA66DRAFT_573713 [Pyrenochaeta sp. MPI-SDFR-AT-0127]|nr:hypothetical protein BKA66DRAFT_573713 [Pyrenochaeta sp. MPI-SDFR-AT-0127]
METSRYFERTLFYDRSPAADEYYERSADLIFEKDVLKARIEVRYQPSNVDSRHRKLGIRKAYLCKERARKEPLGSEDSEAVSSKLDQPISEAKDERYQLDYNQGSGRLFRLDDSSDSDDAKSLSSKASSTALPNALDQRQGDFVPPMYPGLPKLTIETLDPSNIADFVQRTKNDFRVFYLRQRHSHSRIQITKQIFEQLLQLCNVFPRFNEYLIGFGNKGSDSEVGPPPLKFRPLYTARSNLYRGFECSYILRYVEFTNRSEKRNPWSLRQFAIYHRYKPSEQSRCSTWILVGASQRTELRLDRYTRSIEDLIQANPFELHVIFLDTAIASWRPYLVHLTQLVTYQSNKALGTIMAADSADEQFLSIDVDDHQNIKQVEDEVSDLMLCLDSTLDTVSTFEEMYTQFRFHRDESYSIKGSQFGSGYGSDAVIFALREKTKELIYTRKKAEALLSRVQNTRTLISSLMERQSGHNIDQQIAALHKLERQGQDDNIIMRQLAEKSSHDSSSVRILTIITMIYLPCTIVSNFFSTQFVSSKELDTGDTKLEYTTNAWLFFAISVPLTIITILVWYLWVNSDQILQHVFKRNSIQQQSLHRVNRLFGNEELLIGLPR